MIAWARCIGARAKWEGLTFCLLSSSQVAHRINENGRKSIPQKTAGLDKRTADLESAIPAITKSFGEGSIMRLGDEGANLQIDAVSTGSLGLDIALGVGGVPRGRIIEIYGPESSGKTTLMLHIVANAQKAGGTAAFIDAEHALDPAYAANLGVNLGETADLPAGQRRGGADDLRNLARSGAVDVIVIDSVAALVPRAELEGDMGMATMGMQARLMSQALRKLAAILGKSKTMCLFTNQMRRRSV
ncbi:MAG: hypothetical protein CM1200mP29_08820 [Verrucomicrobiota bacterium]|nr:MAG: hypothetical protein CM1200mP29_08820 [Verrucomicrobiota bacterium]